MDAIQLHSAGIGVSHHWVGKGYSKVFDIQPGSTIGQHAHLKDHKGVLIMGRVVITTGGIRGELTAPSLVGIPAGVPHEISAVEHSLWACVWDDAEGCITPEEFDAKVTP